VSAKQCCTKVTKPGVEHEDRDVVTERKSAPGAGGVYRRAGTARRRRDEGRRGKESWQERGEEPTPVAGESSSPCVNRAGEAVVEKAVEFSIWRFLTIVSTDDVNKIDG
jgi:predicted phage gp36 major capsid-like protein